MRAIITVGVPASGKSTLAKKYIEAGYLEINRDDLRVNLFDLEHIKQYKFTSAREKEVTAAVERLILSCAVLQQNIVISDTNLNRGRREHLIQLLSDLGYIVEIIPCHVTFQEALKRDSKRAESVGYEVLGRMWENWIQFLVDEGLHKKYEPDYSLPRAIVVDIDGTVADHTNIRSPYDWEKVGSDRIRNNVASTVKMLTRDGKAKLIFLSGRDSVCRSQTEKWLDEQCFFDYELYMRPEGDTRPDTEVKAEMFWRDVAPSHCVEIVFDDRPCMVHMWYDFGIDTVFSVADPRKLF